MNALAGILYASFHAITNPAPSGGHLYAFTVTNHHFVKFHHRNYIECEHYPFGILNVVGYWAETQLFGGVLLFDRGDSGLEVR